MYGYRSSWRNLWGTPRLSTRWASWFTARVDPWSVPWFQHGEQHGMSHGSGNVMAFCMACAMEITVPSTTAGCIYVDSSKGCAHHNVFNISSIFQGLISDRCRISRNANKAGGIPRWSGRAVFLWDKRGSSVVSGRVRHVIKRYSRSAQRYP